jgi:tRNA (guanine37-N1)-methyltransferase
MVMKPEPVFEAVESVLGLDTLQTQPVIIPVILLTPQGRVFSQRLAEELVRHERIALICGRYEGVDERIREHLVTDEISIGDYVLTGGELPALMVIDAVSRLIPGVLGDPTGAEDDSHSMGLLEYPHYTKPPEFRGAKVPDVLISGNHAKINKWRREQALTRTFNKRPDMLEKAELSKEDKKFIESLSRSEDDSHLREAPSKQS